MKNLKKSFKSSPKYSIKWSNYFDIYENLFKKFVNKNITLVEVGIGNGGSLFMWRKFFGKKIRIIGVEYKSKGFTGDQICKDRNIKIVYNKRDHSFSSSGLRQRVTLMEEQNNREIIS